MTTRVVAFYNTPSRDSEFRNLTALANGRLEEKVSITLLEGSGIQVGERLHELGFGAFHPRN